MTTLTEEAQSTIVTIRNRWQLVFFIWGRQTTTPVAPQTLPAVCWSTGTYPIGCGDPRAHSIGNWRESVGTSSRVQGCGMNLSIIHIGGGMDRGDVAHAPLMDGLPLSEILP